VAAAIRPTQATASCRIGVRTWTAQTEHIIPTGHSAHQDPQAIAEVLHILKAHAR
jgi:hypothetical protein